MRITTAAKRIDNLHPSPAAHFAFPVQFCNIRSRCNLKVFSTVCTHVYSVHVHMYNVFKSIRLVDGHHVAIRAIRLPWADAVDARCKVHPSSIKSNTFRFSYFCYSNRSVIGFLLISLNAHGYNLELNCGRNIGSSLWKGTCC